VTIPSQVIDQLERLSLGKLNHALVEDATSVNSVWLVNVQFVEHANGVSVAGIVLVSILNKITLVPFTLTAISQSY
jgi:hypothetical protein